MQRPVLEKSEDSKVDVEPGGWQYRKGFKEGFNVLGPDVAQSHVAHMRCKPFE
jgi:hypothetical protein